jgi:hypothetical protein
VLERLRLLRSLIVVLDFARVFLDRFRLLVSNIFSRSFRLRSVPPKPVCFVMLSPKLHRNCSSISVSDFSRCCLNCERGDSSSLRKGWEGLAGDLCERLDRLELWERSFSFRSASGYDERSVLMYRFITSCIEFIAVVTFPSIFRSNADRSGAVPRGPRFSLSILRTSSAVAIASFSTSRIRALFSYHCFKQSSAILEQVRSEFAACLRSSVKSMSYKIAAW